MDKTELRVTAFFFAQKVAFIVVVVLITMGCVKCSRKHHIGEHVYIAPYYMNMIVVHSTDNCDKIREGVLKCDASSIKKSWLYCPNCIDEDDIEEHRHE